ncbi:sugar phosphate isomerase/epimerase family protein [Mucilaginibacter psychrotolerans]|uniref:Sugar phosphate isomerase/epimerase n=1 Tax=Mucilaginibacter psychrotolerans TaxID=1524096 RepID=A0A4Y8S6L8_9SPHI|nr:sugar phosphate isomerase/epimerase [Mucilaginibacter psychrotolerans]TFF34097.1 sugar phosphate isomerase/epimerase [Mucilaginibacter psychrotolerans]
MKTTSFLFFTAALALAGCSVPKSAKVAQTNQSLFTAPIGVQAYTYRASFSARPEAVLDSVKALGITQMEGPNPKGVDIFKFRQMLDKRGISMPSIGVDYDMLVKEPLEAVRMAGILGSQFVMVAWLPHGKTFTIDDAKKAVTDLNKAGRTLKANSLTLCYHIHGYEFGPYEDGTLFDYIAKNTDPRYVKFEMDVMWAFHGGADPAKLMLKYPTRWRLMHLKDIRKGVANDLTGGTDIRNDVALGTGQINIPEVLKAAKAVGIRHYFIEDESPDHAKQIPETIKYLKGL